jgi:hypothetical protein
MQTPLIGLHVVMGADEVSIENFPVPKATVIQANKQGRAIHHLEAAGPLHRNLEATKSK